MSNYFLRPRDLNELLEIKNRYKNEAVVLSGGTDLVVNLKSGMINPKYIITTRKALEKTKLIYERDDNLVIEAKATLTDVENNSQIKEKFPELIEAVSLIGSKQIRNYATLIGNVCNASPAGDSLPPLMVNDSEVVLQSVEGVRSVKIKDFLVGPRKTIIKDNEIATQIMIPLPDHPFKYSRYFKLTRTRAVDISGLGICVKMNTSHDVKIALGAVAPTCIRCCEIETIIARDDLQKLNASDIAEMIASCSSPISDLRASKEFRLKVIKQKAKEMLLECQEILKKEYNHD